MKYEDYLFCSECGSLRDLASGEGSKLICLVCQSKTSLSDLANHEYVQEMHFREAGKLSKEKEAKERQNKKQPPSDGTEFALVDEECPKCGHAEMKFYTMQLRSADEGQTVFYECPKCQHKYKTNN